MGGILEIKKICWVNWEGASLPKLKGGFRVKNLKLFNISLLV